MQNTKKIEKKRKEKKEIETKKRENVRYNFPDISGNEIKTLHLEEGIYMVSTK